MRSRYSWHQNNLRWRNWTFESPPIGCPLPQMWLMPRQPILPKQQNSVKNRVRQENGLRCVVHCFWTCDWFMYARSKKLLKRVKISYLQPWKGFARKQYPPFWILDITWSNVDIFNFNSKFKYISSKEKLCPRVICTKWGE